MYPTLKAHGNLCFPLRRAYLLLYVFYFIQESRWSSPFPFSFYPLASSSCLKDHDTYIQLDVSWLRLLLLTSPKGEYHHDSCMKYKTIIKDRSFTEGSRGCHVLLWLDAQNLNVKERHFILPLVIWTFIMQSVTFIASISQDRIKLIFSTLINHTYLESNFYCMQQWQLTWRILLNP